MTDRAAAAIGVFDSGVGGLTVLRALIEKLPKENYIYLGDTARLPYGNKSPETIVNYCRQNMKWLKDRGVKAIVIACNSASANWTESHYQSIPTLNVIDPGVDQALQQSISGNIAVLGTRATVQSMSYVHRLTAEAHRQSRHLNIHQMACPLFVPLVEEGWIDDPLTNLVAYRYLQPLQSQAVDTAILGCTHYPVLHNSIQRVLGNHVKLIDSGRACAEVLLNKILNQEIPAITDSDTNLSGTKKQGIVELYFTDLTAPLVELSKLLLQGVEITSTEKADIVSN